MYQQVRLAEVLVPRGSLQDCELYSRRRPASQLIVYR
jgi:hypothetical protein